MRRMLGAFLGQKGLKDIAGRFGSPFRKALEGDMKVRKNICSRVISTTQVLLVILCGPWEGCLWSPRRPPFMSPVQMSSP